MTDRLWNSDLQEWIYPGDGENVTVPRALLATCLDIICLYDAGLLNRDEDADLCIAQLKAVLK